MRTRSLALVLALGASALQAEEIKPLIFKWGSDRMQVGGGPGISDGREAVPAAWSFHDKAELHVLDTINRRIVRFELPPVDLVPALGKECIPADFARYQTGWLVADRASGRLVHVGEKGKLVTEWKGLGRAARVESAPDGRAYVLDENSLTVSRLAKDGKLEPVSDRAGATPVPAPDGGVWLGRALFGRGVLAIQKPGGAPQVVAVLRAEKDGSAVQGLEVSGSSPGGEDAMVALHEGKGDDRHGVRVVLVSADGSLKAAVRLPPQNGKWMTLPRFYRPMLGPQVGAFAADDEKGWSLAMHKLAPVTGVPGPRPPEPAAAAARAAEALCGADALAAKKAALDAALAHAFDPAGARHEAQLELLEGGVPAAELCALAKAESELAAKPEDAIKSVAAVKHARLADRKLFVEARAHEAAGKTLEALRAYQRLVLDHPASAHYSAAQEAVLKIVESGKLPGAQPKK